MKTKLIALLTALLVLLTGCGALAPESESGASSPESASISESESVPPPPESASDPESVCALPLENASAPESQSAPSESAPDPEPTGVSRWYIEDTSLDGIEDEGPVEALSKYLLENLTPKEYGIVDPYGDIDSSLWPGETKWIHSVRVVAPDRAPIDALLENYEGPYAPVWFYQNERTLSDLTQAEKDVKSFLAKHPEIKVMGMGGSWPQMVFIEVEELSDELTAFAEDYPVKDIYDIVKYSPGVPD